MAAGAAPGTAEPGGVPTGLRLHWASSPRVRGGVSLLPSLLPGESEESSQGTSRSGSDTSLVSSAFRPYDPAPGRKPNLSRVPENARAGSGTTAPRRRVRGDPRQSPGRGGFSAVTPASGGHRCREPPRRFHLRRWTRLPGRGRPGDVATHCQTSVTGGDMFSLRAKGTEHRPRFTRRLDDPTNFGARRTGSASAHQRAPSLTPARTRLRTRGLLATSRPLASLGTSCMPRHCGRRGSSWG